MRCSSWITKATERLRIFNTLVFFSMATMGMRTRLNVTLHTNCLYCLAICPVRIGRGYIWDRPQLHMLHFAYTRMTGGMVVYQHILLCSLEVTLFPTPVQWVLHTGQDSTLHNKILIEQATEPLPRNLQVFYLGRKSSTKRRWGRGEKNSDRA